MRYIQSKTNVIADALSRVCWLKTPEDQGVPLLEANAITTPAKLDEIGYQSSQNIVPSHLEDVIHQGWPEYPNECPSGLKEFWNFREDLSVENGLSI